MGALWFLPGILIGLGGMWAGATEKAMRNQEWGWLLFDLGVVIAIALMVWESHLCRRNDKDG